MHKRNEFFPEFFTKVSKKFHKVGVISKEELTFRSRIMPKNFTAILTAGEGLNFNSGGRWLVVGGRWSVVVGVGGVS